MSGDPQIGYNENSSQKDHQNKLDRIFSVL